MVSGLILLGVCFSGCRFAADPGVWGGVGWGFMFVFAAALLVFICMHWDEAAKPFLISLAGCRV
jgi:hypothetical protein